MDQENQRLVKMDAGEAVYHFTRRARNSASKETKTPSIKRCSQLGVPWRRVAASFVKGKVPLATDVVGLYPLVYRVETLTARVSKVETTLISQSHTQVHVSLPYLVH